MSSQERFVNMAHCVQKARHEAGKALLCAAQSVSQSPLHHRVMGGENASARMRQEWQRCRKEETSVRKYEKGTARQGKDGWGEKQGDVSQLLSIS